MKNQAMNENVKATVSTTYFTFNHLTRKIVGTELNFKKSGTPGSAHDIELMARIAEHPNYDFLVIKPEKEKNSYADSKRDQQKTFLCFIHPLSELYLVLNHICFTENYLLDKTL